MFFSLTESAEKLGISRAWLYRHFLPRYPPIKLAGHPMLSTEQIARIRAEIKKKSNGNGHK